MKPEGHKGWGRVGGSKAGIFLEEEGNERCLYLEIELDAGDEKRSRGGLGVWGILRDRDPQFTLILTPMQIFTHLHTQHSGTLTWRDEAKQKGKETNADWKERKRPEVKGIGNKAETWKYQGKEIMFSFCTACWISVECSSKWVLLVWIKNHSFSFVFYLWCAWAYQFYVNYNTHQLTFL